MLQRQDKVTDLVNSWSGNPTGEVSESEAVSRHSAPMTHDCHLASRTLKVSETMSNMHVKAISFYPLPLLRITVTLNTPPTTPNHQGPSRDASLRTARDLAASRGRGRGGFAAREGAQRLAGRPGCGAQRSR